MQTKLQDEARRFFFEQQQAANMLRYVIGEHLPPLINLRFVIGEAEHGKRVYFPHVKPEELSGPNAPWKAEIEESNDLVFCSIQITTEVLQRVIDQGGDWDTPVYLGLSADTKFPLAWLNAALIVPDRESKPMFFYLSPSVKASYETSDYGTLGIDDLLQIYHDIYK